jgi:hypothetical protein
MIIFSNLATHWFLVSGNWTWPLAYFYALLGVLYFKFCRNQSA